MEIAHLPGPAVQTETTIETSGNNAKNNTGAFTAELEKALSINKTPKGYAYIDKYGFSHVVEAYETALQFVKPETEIYGYNGDFQGGYAAGPEDGSRMALPIPGSVAYGNEQEDNEKVEHEHTASVISLTDFLEKYSGYLSLLPFTDKEYSLDIIG